MQILKRQTNVLLKVLKNVKFRYNCITVEQTHWLKNSRLTLINQDILQ